MLINSSSLQPAWIQFLDHWDWAQFTTNTFREEVHPERADRLWCIWISMMNRKLYGHRWWKRGQGLYWCRSLEWQQRGVAHFHALLGGEGASDLDCRRWQEEWWRLAGIARMEKPRSQHEVKCYLTKHISRGAEIDLGGPLVAVLKAKTVFRCS